MLKQSIHKIKGMQRDLSVSAFNPEYAYENKNIRIMPTDDSTLLSIINEKGNKNIDIIGINNIEGTPIGQCVLDNNLILFTTDNINSKTDYIYKLWFNKNELNGKLLYKGDLNFNYKFPIEALAFYENTDIKKVYWTDKLNSPRVINIEASDDIISKWNNNTFNFIRSINLKESVIIEKNNISSGMFDPGVIQYAFTYFDKYGQESNIFYTSPLYYISFNDRGASPEEKVNNSFLITLFNLDINFDYVRVYSIHRTSIDATPTCKRVTDIATSNSTIYYTDTGTSGDLIDPTELLYVGGEDIIVGTMSQKDNTLFLGDITLKRKNISNSIREAFKEGNIEFINDVKYISSTDPIGLYPYSIQLNDNSYQIKTFKYLETYRFGVQFQHYTGKWSNPIWINDKRNPLHIKTHYDKKSEIYLPIASFNFNNSDIINELIESGYIKARPVIVYPSLSDRECICQGILCPTVYNVSDRYGNAPFAQASWFIRPNAPYDVTKAFQYEGETVIFTMQDTYSVTNNPTKFRITDTDIVFSLKNYDFTKDIIAGIRIEGNDDIPSSGNIELLEGGSGGGVYSSYESNSGGQKWMEDWYNRESIDFNNYSVNSRAGVMSNYSTTANLESGSSAFFDLINKGIWAEFRHNYPIPSNDDKRAEIQCIYNPPENPYVDSNVNKSETIKWVSNNAENYYIDQSIVTLHSPDIEFDDSIKNLDTTKLKLRIIGIVPLTAFQGDIDIQTSTPPNNYVDKEGNATTNIAPGFYKEPIGDNNLSRFGFKALMSGAFWFDELSDYNSGTGNKDGLTTAFVVYPWHRNGSLNNTKYATDGYRSAMLDTKKISNLRFSYNSFYFDTDKIWNAYIEGNNTFTGISGVSIFDSNEVSLIRIPAPQNSSLPDINYYGNIDKVLTITRVGDKKDGYPIVTTGVQNSEVYSHLLFYAKYNKLDNEFTSQITGTDPVRIKYKSTPHAVMALNYSYNPTNEDKSVRVLPTLKDGDSVYTSHEYWNINYIGEAIPENKKQFWESSREALRISQDVLDISFYGKNNSVRGEGPEYGWLWLGELYNDSITKETRFGGQTEEAFENNQWLPCGESISLINEDNTAKSSIELKWIEGDTYYQRYDHIKTYPFTLEDQNSITDIVSFMCETRVNLDGRYDKNRGQINNMSITPENFNLLNDVYSQSNNFFNYRYDNLNKLYITDYPNTITWTKTKTSGELIDTWTNITLASTLDLDGDKGNIRSIKRLNNNLIAFQDKGISQILYNENMQITSTEGVPIEIANSGKVNGKRYITDRIGCSNKWSICETPNGIYFIDDITKGIFLFNGKLDNISDRLGFHSWINSRSTDVNIWNPIDFNGFVTYYDKVNGDVFFISKDECLAFSEPLGQFTSFYSYERTPYFSNIEDKGIFFNVEDGGTIYKPWLHNEGDYNIYFGTYHPFYTTIISNPDMSKDKVFNNLEFRSDTWDSNNNLLNTTFDTLNTWNEYQKGASNLNNIIGKPSNLKRKFRIWRANIPRANTNGIDRMRNPWLYIKLSMEKENTNKTILHDMIVHYFE